jgi:hypothetical protein
MEDFVKNIDYRMLTGQKRSLCKIQENPLLSQNEKDAIEGVLNLIDALQDKVVEKEILPESEVFPYLGQEDEGE